MYLTKIARERFNWLGDTIIVHLAQKGACYVQGRVSWPGTGWDVDKWGGFSVPAGTPRQVIGITAPRIYHLSHDGFLRFPIIWFPSWRPFNLSGWHNQSGGDRTATDEVRRGRLLVFLDNNFPSKYLISLWEQKKLIHFDTWSTFGTCLPTDS